MEHQKVPARGAIVQHAIQPRLVFNQPTSCQGDLRQMGAIIPPLQIFWVSYTTFQPSYTGRYSSRVHVEINYNPSYCCEQRIITVKRLSLAAERTADCLHIIGEIRSVIGKMSCENC